MKTTTTKPFVPVADLEFFFNYNVDDPTTHSASPLVNAVAEALQVNKRLTVGSIARYLCIDAKKLTGALQIEAGCSLSDIIKEIKLRKIPEYIQNHPEETLSEISKNVGYSGESSLWRMYSRNKLGAPKQSTNQEKEQ